MPLAVFRFYASSWRGAGHAYRCLTLAQALQSRGWSCSFITEAESFEFVPALAGFERLDPDDFYNNPVRSDLLVVDHYDCDSSYESRFRLYTKKIVVIDDLANRPHDCDILLDQTYGRTIEEYKHLTPPHCVLLTGASYALLRPSFATLRPEALRKRAKVKTIGRVLVNFGGNDQANNILTTLKALEECRYKGGIDIVYGVIAPHKQSVEEYAAKMSNDITSHVSPDMATLMYDCDLAVGAAGTTTWERCCLGLPSILIETADNQRTIIQNLCDDGAVIGSGYDCLSQKGLLHDFDIELYADWVARAASVCDGCGVERLLDCLDKRPGDIIFRLANHLDVKDVYAWRNHPSTREMSLNKSEIPYEQHQAWFAKALATPEMIMVIAEADKKLGIVRFDRAGDDAVVSIHVNPSCRGKGLGRLLLEGAEDFLRVWEVSSLHAIIRRDNKASIKSFEKAGYVRADEMPADDCLLYIKNRV